MKDKYKSLIKHCARLARWNFRVNCPPGKLLALNPRLFAINHPPSSILLLP